MPSKGYHNDQFFNLKGEGPIRAGNGYKALVPDNPKFEYPSRIVRTDDQFGSKNVELQRGYLRSLVTGNEALATGVRKCQFQFNPTTLQQSVSMATGMLNVMQQDPAQFAQPFASSQNFSFTLMFDRSMEINNDSGKFVVGGDDVDVWRQNSPGQVGVLRDLQALYQTIGQGFSTQQRDYIAQVLKDTVKAEASNTDAPADAADQLDKANTNIDKENGFLDINIGNAAFLLPVPVRIVFSSLYVVEGLVSNTSVVFTKFSTKMVPMQCMVTITMEAKYIGFSKQRTFFTEVLRQREEMEAAEKQAAVDNKNEIIAAFQKACSTMYLTVYNGFALDDASFGEHTFSTLLPAKGTPFRLGLSIPGARSNSEGVNALYEDGSSMLATHGGTVTVYGPFTSEVNSLSTKVNLGTWAKVHGTKLASASYSTSGFGNDSASTKGEWANFIERAVGKSVAHTTTAVGAFSSSYFVIHWEGYVQVKLDNGERIKGTGDRWVVYGPGSSITNKLMTYGIQLMWPKAVEGGTGPNGSAAQDNAATNPPKAGSTGNASGGKVPV